MAETFQSFLVLEGKDIPKPLVLEDKGTDQTMRVKVPFYIGDSIANAPGFSKKIFFPSSLLQEIVQEGKSDIAAKMQPLTVYARHAHAADASYLPIGGVSDLTAEGRVGYAILDIEPTTYGKDVQTLLRANPPKINAVSLRSGKSSFEMEAVEVNGESMLQPKKLRISGIDFAPDSPAMKTYGIEVLAAENVNVKSIKKEKEDNNTELPEKLTLEMVKANPEIIAEIERPIVTRIDEEIEKNKKLTAENAKLKQLVAETEMKNYVEEIASKHPKPVEARPILLEIAKTCSTKEEFAGKTFPILMEALSSKKIETKPKEDSAEEKLRKLFGGADGVGKGESKKEDLEAEEEEFKGEHVGPLEVPS